MHSTVAMKRADQVLEEMRRHRQATPVKRPVHPGVTQKEAGLTPRELSLLSKGACNFFCAATDAGTRLAHRALAVLVVALGLALAVRPLAKHFGWMVGGQ